MSELLLTSGLTPAQRQFAHGIKTSGDALLALINDILDLSKVEAGRLELERVPIDVVECVEGALDMAAGAAAAKGLALLCHIDEEVPACVLGDPTRLRQVIVNLVSNAVKFTAQGEVVVSVGLRTAAGVPPKLQIAVSDTGVGIPADRMDRLFQVFSQVDASTTRQFGGTGLGLAICRHIVAMMGGRIWVTSEVGRGSTFEFHMPCEAVAAPAAEAEGVTVRPFAGRRVLLVDDNARARNAVAAQLRRLGLQVRAVATLADALEALRDDPPWDAVLLDEPGAQPGAAAQALRAAGRGPLLLLRPRWAPETAATDGAATVFRPVRQQALREALAGLFAEADCAPAPAAGVAPALAALLQASTEAPLRVLLAEDNQINQMVAQHLLDRLGHAVDTVDDGEQALAAVAAAEASGAPFDVVLMDVQMPVLDGLAASRRLCEASPEPRARPWIIALTANAMHGDREECLAAGMDDYLSKPMRAAEVAAALREAARQLAERRAA
jgi:CheY-like chemotaxis protein